MPQEPSFIEAARKAVVFRLMAEKETGVRHHDHDGGRATDYSCCVVALCQSSGIPETDIPSLVDAVYTPEFRAATRLAVASIAKAPQPAS